MATETPWTPTVPSDGSLEDVSLEEWIGQALGAASMCWEYPTFAGEFNSTEAKRIADALIAHVKDLAGPGGTEGSPLPDGVAAR